MDARILSDLVNDFSINGKIKSIRPLGNGLINDTYLVETEEKDEEDYVLQRINTDIFRDPDILQENLLVITDHIRKKQKEAGVEDVSDKTLTIVRTKDGKLYKAKDGKVWRMTVFIKDSVSNETVTPEMAYLTGKAFGEFHGYFSGEDTPEIKESIPDFHNIVFRIENLKKSLEKDVCGRAAEVKEITDELLRREEEMCVAVRLNKEGKLPKRISHCDTKLNNILFDKEGNIKCVIDLDTTMPGFILSDFGDFIRTAANQGEEDDKDLSRVNVDMDIFREFAKGYVESATFLTETEKRLLPFGAKMLTYMQTVRFLTDWLDGDVYYKIKYPEHNLVRTKAQLQLLHSIDTHFDEMNKFILNIK